MAPSQDRLAQAAAPIAATLFEPSLTPEKLCRSLGVSRRVLYNVFERYGGVVHYIRRRRLVSCHAAIVDPLKSRRIQTIAYDHGFTDAALFSRVFRAEFGYSPREARDATAASQAFTGEVSGYFRDLLRAL